MTEAEKVIRVAVHAMSDPKPSHAFNDDDLVRLGINPQESANPNVVQYAAEDLLITILFDLRRELDALKSKAEDGTMSNDSFTRDALTYALKNGAVFTSLSNAESGFTRAIEHLVKVGVLRRAAGFETDKRRAYVLTRGGYDYCEGYGIHGNVD